MNIELLIKSQTDKTITFIVEIEAKPKGELQMDRDQFTKFADLMFPHSYKVVENDKSPQRATKIPLVEASI